MKPRKRLMIAVFSILLFLLPIMGIYLALSFRPTGYDTFQHEQREQLEQVKHNVRERTPAIPFDEKKTQKPAEDKDGFEEFLSLLNSRELYSDTTQILINSGLRYGFLRRNQRWLRVSVDPLGDTPRDWHSAIILEKTILEMEENHRERMKIDRSLATQEPAEISKESAERLEEYLDGIEEGFFMASWPDNVSAEELTRIPSSTNVFMSIRWTLIRAWLREDADVRSRYLSRYFQLLADLNSVVPDSFTWERLSLPHFLFLLHQIHPIDRNDLKTVITIMEESRWDEERFELLRRQSILRVADTLRADPDKYGKHDNSWHFFLDGKLEGAVNDVFAPLASRQVEEYAMALIEHDEEKQASAAASLERYGELMNLDWSIPERFAREVIGEEYPTPIWRSMPLFDRKFEEIDRWKNQVVVTAAILIFEKEQGRFPESFEELQPDYLPVDFEEMTRTGWLAGTIEGRAYQGSVEPFLSNAAVEEFNINSLDQEAMESMVMKHCVLLIRLNLSPEVFLVEEAKGLLGVAPK